MGIIKRVRSLHAEREAAFKALIEDVQTLDELINDPTINTNEPEDSLTFFNVKSQWLESSQRFSGLCGRTKWMDALFYGNRIQKQLEVANGHMQRLCSVRSSVAANH